MINLNRAKMLAKHRGKELLKLYEADIEQAIIEGNKYYTITTANTETAELCAEQALLLGFDVKVDECGVMLGGW